MAGLDPAIHLVLCDGVRAKLDPRVKPGDDTCGCGASTSRHRRFNCQTATALQTCVIAPIVCGAGAPSLLAFPAPVRGRAERQVPVAPVGLMRMRSSAIESASG